MTQVLKRRVERAKAFIAGMGRAVDIAASAPVPQLRFRRSRSASVNEALGSDMRQVGRDLAQVIERERGRQTSP